MAEEAGETPVVYGAAWFTEPQPDLEEPFPPRN